MKPHRRLTIGLAIAPIGALGIGAVSVAMSAQGRPATTAARGQMDAGVGANLSLQGKRYV